MPETTIEWATHVWNPFTGCDRVSPGCAHCYAADAAKSLKAREEGKAAKAVREGRAAPRIRYQRDGDPKSSGPGFGFTVHWDKLEKPERFPAGARVFVNSMSDVFHEEAPTSAIESLFAVAACQPKVQFLILTKRPERMQDVLGRQSGAALNGTALQFRERVRRLAYHRGAQDVTTWPLPNVWLGVTIENRRFVHRADILRETSAALRFISAEPLLGPLVPLAYDATFDEDYAHLHWPDGKPAIDPDLPLDLTAIDWLITGGESGPGHRRFDPVWAIELRNWCQAVDPAGERLYPTAFFHKQNGGRRPREGGRELDGRTYNEIPTSAGANL